MKTLKYISPLVIAGILLISACGGGETKETAEEIFMKKIAGSWQMMSADFDGKDVTASFPGLKVIIGKSKTITVQNATPPMWKATSTFTLVEDGTSFMINRDDGLIISMEEVSGSHLVLSFLYDADVMGGRTSSVTGGFTFEFEAN